MTDVKDVLENEVEGKGFYDFKDISSPSVHDLDSRFNEIEFSSRRSLKYKHFVIGSLKIYVNF